MSEHVAPSVAVLRQHGQLDLREITKHTARLLGHQLMYADVDAVLERERQAGRVVLAADPGDFRRRVWKAVV